MPEKVSIDWNIKSKLSKEAKIESGETVKSIPISCKKDHTSTIKTPENGGIHFRKTNGGSHRTFLPYFVSIDNCVFENFDGDFIVIFFI